jgi:Zn-dependent protease with chaperone function
LAHEISHVLRRHETRIAQSRVIDTISLTGATSDLVAALRDPTAISAGVLKTAAAGHKSFRQHYGDQELQADSCAVRVLSAALPIAEVDAAVQSFIAILPADVPAAAALPSSSRGAPRGSGSLDDLVVEVSRPVDRHPTSRERVDNLKAVRAETQGLAGQSQTAVGK